VELSWTSLAAQAEQPAEPPGDPSPAETAAPPSLCVVPAPRARPPRLLALGITVSALAAAVLVAVLLWPAQEERSLPPTAQARVIELFGEAKVITASGEVVPLVAGQEVGQGNILSTGKEDSFVSLRYPDSTRLELSADTTVQLPGRGKARASEGKRVFLFQGFLRAVLPRQQGAPLILANPQVEVSAGGSRVSFWSLPDETRIESEEGQLRLTRRSDGKAVDVRGRSYTVVSADVPDLLSRPLPALHTRPRAELDEGTGPVLSLAFTPGGEFLVTGGWKGQVKFWDPATGKLAGKPLEAHKQSIRGLAFSRDGKVLATAAAERERLKLWEPVSGAQLGLLKGQRTNPMCLAFAPAGATLVAVGGNNVKGGEIKLWDALSGTVRADLSGHVKQILAAAFSPDGKVLATGSRDNTIRLWDVATGKELHVIVAGQRQVWALAFSPDGKLLASGGHNGTVKFWDPATGAQRLQFKAFPRVVKSLAFAPNGQALAVAGDHPAVKLFDPANGKELTSFRGHSYSVCAVRFAPDGRTLATAGWDGMVRLWDLPPALRPGAPRGKLETRLAFPPLAPSPG
jgi:hypothetical protein